MSSYSSISTQFKFIHPEHFTQSGNTDEWFCNICTPLGSGQVDYMTLLSAQQHERQSLEHERNVKETDTRPWNMSPDPDAWTAPPPLQLEPLLTIEQVKSRENQAHVDLVHDLIPFWIRGVEAAKRGEVLRLEEFLERLQDSVDGWGGGAVWSHDPIQGWADAADRGWDTEAYRDTEPMAQPFRARKKNNRALKQKARYRPDVWVSSRAAKDEKNNQIGNENNAYEFVETVARQEAADEERRRQMHDFFEMPTDEKVRKIGEVIRELLGTAAH